MAAKKTPTKPAAGTRAKANKAKAPARVKHAVSPEQVEEIRNAMASARFASAPIAVDRDQHVAQLQAALKLCYGAMDSVQGILLQIEGKADDASSSGDTTQ